MKAILIVFGSLLLSANVYGQWSVGGSLGITAADQGDINTLISNANSREGGISTGQLGNAWDINVFISYRYSDFVTLQLRPSYFFQSEDGTAGSSATNGGKHEYSVSGFSIFPIFRFHLLEDTSMKFFAQIGIGYGIITGTIKEGSRTLDFDGSNLGYMAGLGAEFCINANHCISVEGNLRILGAERLEASGVSGDFTTLAGSLSQATNDQEVEYDNRDLSATMSGVQGIVGYNFYF